MQVITGNTLSQHVEDIAGDIFEAAATQRADDIQPGDIALHHLFHGSQILNYITRRHIFAAVSISSSFDFFIANQRQAQFAEHCLNGACGLIANGDGFLFRDRTQTAVNHQIALQNVVIIEIFSVEVRPGKHVVVVGYRTVTGENKVGTRQHLHQGAGSTANIGVGKGLVIGGGHFKVEH